MEYIEIQKSKYYINSIKSHQPLLEIKFDDNVDLTNIDLSSIILFTEGGTKCNEFHGYITIYDQDSNTITLSNNGSTYEYPVEIPTTPYEPNEPTEEELALQLENAKKIKIQESNKLLEQYLETHPLLYNDGLYYSVTRDKQNLLAGQLLTYQLELQSGVVNPELTWNSTGEICVPWNYTNLVGLALAIKEYVKLFVAKQQEYDKYIQQLNNINEVYGLVITYENIG
jgi:hypothetical protein